jgi:hypothetical protein
MRVLLTAMTLTGCVHYVPIIIQAPKCMPALPTQSCSSPTILKEGSTYADLLNDYLTDRQSLLECALQQEHLREAIATCNRIIDEHNQEAGLRSSGERNWH